MASSTKTENYQLNQYGANDQPTWVGDYSGDMLKIDTALGNAAKRTGDKFNETETYAVGNLCIKDDLLYKFTAAKEAGAWDETKVKATTIEAEFEQLNGDITQLTEKIKITTHVTNTSLYEYIGNAGKKTCPIACVYFDGDNGYCTGFSAETASYDDTSYVAWFNKEHGNGVTFLVIWIQL